MFVAAGTLMIFPWSASGRSDHGAGNSGHLEARNRRTIAATPMSHPGPGTVRRLVVPCTQSDQVPVAGGRRATEVVALAVGGIGSGGPVAALTRIL